MFKKTLTMALLGAAAIGLTTGVAHANPCASPKGGFFAGAFVGAGSSKATVEKLEGAEAQKIGDALRSKLKLSDYYRNIIFNVARAGLNDDDDAADLMLANDKDAGIYYGKILPNLLANLQIKGDGYEAKGLTTAGVELGGLLPFTNEIAGIGSIYGGYDLDQEGFKIGLRLGAGFYVTPSVIIALSAIGEYAQKNKLTVRYNCFDVETERDGSFDVKDLGEWVLGFGVSPSITYKDRNFYFTVSYDFLMSPATEHKAKIDGLDPADTTKPKTTDATLKVGYTEHRVVARAGMCF